MTAPCAPRPHITICISTYKRPALLGRLLTAIPDLDGADTFDVSVVVADNDPQGSAAPVVRDLAGRLPGGVVYCHEPVRSIARARNAGVARARGDYVAFIDDDEYPDAGWLRRLQAQCAADTRIAGVLGPVVPYFEPGYPPAWALRGRFFERARHRTGTVLNPRDCRTGNALLRRSVLCSLDPVFDPQFAAGGEDIDLFERLVRAGHVFVWCDEAVVHEHVPPARCSRRYLLRRALLQGRISLHHRDGHALRSAKCVVAVPAYGVCLPIALLLGEHRALRIAIKLCHHLGRALALFGRHTVLERAL